MKTFGVTTMIGVFLLFCTIGIQAQTTQTKLDQVELMKQIIGKWQADVGKDTIEVWECQQYGKAIIVNVYQVVKGHKTPIYINNIGFDSKENKFKGYALWPDGNYSTWIGSFSTEKMYLVDMVHNFNPETVYAKFESETISPKERNWTSFNKDGVQTSVLKFIKVE